MSKVIAAPKFKRDVEFCGAEFDGGMCHRLPAHHGDHRLFVNGTGVRKPAASKIAPKASAKVVTRAGAKYRETIGKGGVITLTPVQAATPVAPVTPEPEPAAPSKVATSKRSPRAAAKVTPKVAPRVRVIPEAKSRRRVASTSGR